MSRNHAARHPCRLLAAATLGTAAGSGLHEPIPVPPPFRYTMQVTLSHSRVIACKCVGLMPPVVDGGRGNQFRVSKRGPDRLPFTQVSVCVTRGKLWKRQPCLQWQHVHADRCQMLTSGPQRMTRASLGSSGGASASTDPNRQSEKEGRKEGWRRASPLHLTVCLNCHVPGVAREAPRTLTPPECGVVLQFSPGAVPQRAAACRSSVLRFFLSCPRQAQMGVC